MWSPRAPQPPLLLRGTAWAVAAFALAFAGPASAQNASDQAAAEALFKQGRELMSAGQFAAACPKFAESQRLDPAPGTLLNLATCYERNGQIASAWATFKAAAAVARKADQGERARLARDKAAELEPKLPTLTIVVGPSADRPDLQVRRDGEVVGRAEWGTPIPVDPGTHVVDATAAGFKSWQATASVEGPAAKASLEVPPLEPAEPTPAGETSAPAAASLTPPATSVAAAPRPPTDPGATQRTWAWIAGGVGVAGLATSVVLGALALSSKHDASGQCIAGTCDVAGDDAYRKARGEATAADVAVAVGAALVAAGAALYWTAPREPSKASVRVAPMLGAGAYGAAVGGAF